MHGYDAQVGQEEHGADIHGHGFFQFFQSHEIEQCLQEKSSDAQQQDHFVDMPVIGKGAGDQEDAVYEVKDPVVDQEEPGGAAFALAGNGLTIQLQAGCIKSFHRHQVQKIEDPDGHTLEPVDPHDGAEGIGVRLVIPDAIKITEQ